MFVHVYSDHEFKQIWLVRQARAYPVSRPSLWPCPTLTMYLFCEEIIKSEIIKNQSIIPLKKNNYFSWINWLKWYFKLMCLIWKTLKQITCTNNNIFPCTLFKIRKIHHEKVLCLADVMEKKSYNSWIKLKLFLKHKSKLWMTKAL